MNRFLFYIPVLILFVSCKQEDKTPNYTSRVESTTILSKVLNRPVEANIYYTLQGAEVVSNTPIVYLLHGHGGNQDDWFQQEEGNVAHILDSLINIKAIPPVLAVSVNAGNSWYVDSQENMESFFRKEVFNFYLKAKNASDNLLVDQQHQIIAGNSAGGYGALRFTLHEPDRFNSAILLSPAAYTPVPPKISSSRKISVFARDSVFNDSIWSAYNYPNLLDNLNNTVTTKFYLSTGAQDAYNITPVVHRLDSILKQKNQATSLTIIPGGHDWKVWRANFAAHLIAYFAQNREFKNGGN